MKAYNPKFIDAVLQARRWSFIGQQNRSASRAERLRKLKADLIAYQDGENRQSYLNKLKAQIDAGAYYVDSHALALKMLQTEHTTLLKVDRERA
jgi:anti-sigma28 factor (negative regulator of flagellin synthesis)